MHTHEIITTRITSVRGCLYDDHDAFAIREDCRHVWLQRACCWILTKLGAFRRDRRDPHMRHTAIRIDEYRILEYLQDHKTNLEQFWGRQNWRVVLGRDAACELWGTMASREPWCHMTEARLRQGGHPDRIFKMRIQVVPWIEGAFLLPETITNT